MTTNLKSTKYDRANAFDIPVIKRQSIYDAWKQRANPKFEFNDKFYKKYIYDVSIFEIFYRSSLIRVANPAKNLEWYFSGAPKTLRVVRSPNFVPKPFYFRNHRREAPDPTWTVSELNDTIFNRF